MLRVGIFGTIWAHRRLKELFGKATEERFDYLGAILFSSALTIVLLALTIGDLQSLVALIPMHFTLIVIGPTSGRLSDRYGGRGLSTLGLATTSGVLLVFSTFSTDTAIISITAALAFAGFGIGLFRSRNASSVMASVPTDRRGIGAGVRSTILNTSSVLSIPLALALMTAVMPYDNLAVVVSATSLGSQHEVPQLLDAIRYAFYAFAIINALSYCFVP